MNENKFDIRLLKRSSLSKTEAFKDAYNNWRNYKKNSGGPFFAIYRDMSEHLNEISHGALKLYIYYGFASKNDTGDSWHAVGNVAKALDVAPRTVDNWNKELVELGFIERISAGKKSKSVFLLPLSDYIFHLSSIAQMNTWLKTTEFDDVYGEPVKKLHLVQMKESKQKIVVRRYDIVVTRKKYGKLNTRYTIFRYLAKNTTLIPDIDLNEMDDNICRLEDNENIVSFDVDTDKELWFVNSDIKLNDDQLLQEFVLTLVKNDVDISSYEINGWK